MSVPCPPNWEENETGDEGPHESQLAKRPRHSGCCDDTQVLLKEMLKMQHSQNELLQKQYQGLQEKIASLEADMTRFHGYLQQTAAPRMLSDQHCGVALQLKFLNPCKNDKYSTRIIEADDGGPLKVAICGNNKIIECEPFSSMRVRVVPIHSDFDNDHAGQWSEDYFHSKIVIGRPGRENFLSGDLYIWLQDGVGYLNGAKFQDNSSFVASKKVKLGVMVADQRITQRIQEGITESFAVKDILLFYSSIKSFFIHLCHMPVWTYLSVKHTKKNIYPAPRDAVHKLSRIAMNGDRRKFLEEKGIKTVEDFRCSYRKSPQDLRKILGKISDQEWEKLVKHAFKQNPRPVISSNCTEERNVHHKHETFSSKDGSCNLQGLCSTQASPAPQTQIAEQLEVQVSQQQISWSNNELLSSASLDNLPCIQTSVEEQVSGVENGFLQFSSMGNNVLEGSISQQCHRSSECRTMLAGNVLPQINSPVNNDLEDVPLEDFCKLLFGTETELLEEDVSSWVNDFPEDSEWVDSCSPFKQIGGCSYLSEEASITYTGASPASEIGSRSYREPSPSPARRAVDRSSRAFSFSPANRARGKRCTRFSPSPVRGADKGR